MSRTIFDQVEAPQVERGLLDHACITEGDVACLRSCHLAVKGHFGCEFVAKMATAGGLKDESAQEVHRASTCCTAAERRAQLSCCAARAFLPRAVIL